VVGEGSRGEAIARWTSRRLVSQAYFAEIAVFARLRPLMHAPLPCAILVSPSLPQDQQHVRDSVRVLHTAVHVGCPAEDRRSGRPAPFILPAGTGISPDVVHLIGCRR
jgi:hypothetical protein